MALRGPPKFGQSLQSSGKGGRPGQGLQKRHPTSDYQQYAATPYPGHEALLQYEMLLHVHMEVDQEEERHEHQFQEVRHKRYYEPVPSCHQALAPTYACAVAPAARREVAPQAHPEIGTEVLMQQLEAAGQPVPPTASFLQDNLAIIVMEELLNQIKLIKRQRISALEQINCTTKRKLLSLEGLAVVATAYKPKVPEAPVEEILLDQQDEEMDEVPLFREDLEFMDHFESIAPSAGQKVGPMSRGLAGLVHALNVLGPSKYHRGHKLPIFIGNLELINFPADIPARAEFAQLLFMKEVIFPVPPSQLAVVKLTTDPRTPAKYDGLVATEAAGKEKQRALQSEEEEEAEEGELAAQRFQRVQHNKKLAKKKANKAKAAAALAHRVQNDFSGCIPDGLGVKVWGPLDVERLNLCFCGALGPCHYYLYLTNTVFVGADANCAAAFEFSSGQSAKIPGTKVYQYTCQGFPGTPYELKQLYKYYANPHVPCHNRIVAYMLLSELKDFTQRCNVSLHDCTMTLLCSDPAYRDLVNPMQGLDDLQFAEKRCIPSRFLRVKDDGSTVLSVTCTPDPNVPFDLEQLAQYALIFGRPGMENIWQGIAVDSVYQMHWQTLFGFALCRALCANSAGKTTLIQWMALVMVHPGLSCEAIDAFNKVYNEPFAAQYGPQLTITQVHVPDNKVRNFSDDDAIHVLLYNYILVEWVDHAYTYGVVYLEQQFHQPTMSLDIFHDINNKHLEHLKLYGTPTAILHWDGGVRSARRIITTSCLNVLKRARLVCSLRPMASIIILVWTQMWVSSGKEHRRTLRCLPLEMQLTLH
ncbi:hypothetical protein C0992_003263 [Termitomyces sp. T32_za158]|nr:hypothetical protein C0992_003263 [Termitomyces sp. T32_za158]